MDRKSAERLIEGYIGGWRSFDKEMSLSVLHPDAIVYECYGPVYHGAEEIGDWFDGWHAADGKVLCWDIENIHYDFENQTGVAQWYFECHSQGQNYEFFGCSVFEFCEGKIISVKEYDMDKEKSYPYAKDQI